MSGPIRALEPSTYQRHAIHGEGRIWAETNCYVDVVVELLHGLGFEPIAALPFTLRIDFEGDQWTFFKFPHHDLLTLFGLDIQELNPWRSLALHIEHQVAVGHPVLVELDSYFLPDTHSTAYRREHVKSTVAVNEIDVEKRHLGYFHGQGYHHLSGSDFTALFQLDGLVHERMLPPYVEYLRRAADAISEEDELVQASLSCLRQQLSLLPKRNPFFAFKARFLDDLAWLADQSIETFHGYSFATLRQCGSCFELAATYLRWLSERGETGLAPSIRAMLEISKSAKAMQFQLARAVARGGGLNLDPLDRMGQQWREGMNYLSEKYR